MPLAVLTIAIAALAADAYTPPRQTPTQMAKMQAWSREAEKLSAAATPALLAKLGSADFRRALGECCPVAAAMSPHQLLAALRAELRAAELVHNFPTDTAANDTMVEDTSLAAEAGGNLSYFANIWEYAYSAGRFAVTPATGQIEVWAFGFPAFTGGNATDPANFPRAWSGGGPAWFFFPCEGGGRNSHTPCR